MHTVGEIYTQRKIYVGEYVNTIYGSETNFSFSPFLPISHFTYMLWGCILGKFLWYLNFM